MAYNAPEGTADMLPAAARLWRSTVDSAAKLFGTYGYEPITRRFSRLPMCYARYWRSDRCGGQGNVRRAQRRELQARAC